MRWNNTYDRIIAQCILQSGFNLPVAFYEAQKILESDYLETVSRKAISSRYYREKEYIQDMIDDLIDEYKEEEMAAHYKETKKPWYMKLWTAVQSMLNINQRL